MPAPTFSPGTPCWVDLMTPDIGRAQDFYGAVLGWSFTSADPQLGGYVMCHTADGAVAGMALRGDTPGPFSTCWTVYLFTPDLDGTLAAAQAGGGNLMMGPHEVPGQGRMALVTDPSGAVVGLWEPGGHRGFAEMGPPGSPCWFEVATREGPAVRDFFGGLYGLQPAVVSGMEYWTLKAADEARFGVLQMTDVWGEMPPHWMTYFSVLDIEASVQTLLELGGTVHHGPFNSPFGRIAVVGDPMGATFTLMQRS